MVVPRGVSRRVDVGQVTTKSRMSKDGAQVLETPTWKYLQGGCRHSRDGARLHESRG